MKRPAANKAAIDCIKFFCLIQSTPKPTAWSRPSLGGLIQQFPTLNEWGPKKTRRRFWGHSEVVSENGLCQTRLTIYLLTCSLPALLGEFMVKEIKKPARIPSKRIVRPNLRPRAITHGRTCRVSADAKQPSLEGFPLREPRKTRMIHSREGGIDRVDLNTRSRRHALKCLADSDRRS